MKHRFFRSFILTTALLQLVSCSGSGPAGSSSASNTISGIAATGAPISGGEIKVKGANGQVVSTTTLSNGSYSANISVLDEPYLVQVTAPSGEKYISVASQSALAEGKKVNVTPLTHSIVSNVFGSANGDQIFSNFQSESTKFSEAKLEEEKQELVQKFIDAGLLGNGKIAAANIDLLNGDFVAGSGQGVDGLLDVISVNTDASAGIEVSLKGGGVIITDVVTGADPAVNQISAGELTSAKEQLSTLDKIRARMNALAALHSSYVSCNGTPTDNGGACDVDTLYAAFAPYFHTDFQEDGDGREAGLWGWFCRGDNDQRANSKAQCLSSGNNVEFEKVSLKDITLIKYDENTKVALINFNFYLNGVLKGSEDMTLKYDVADQTFDLLGNKKTFDYWIETEALHNTEYNKTSNQGTDTYSVNLNFYMKDDKAHNFVGGETLTLTTASNHTIFPSDLKTMPVYMVKAPIHDQNNQCTVGVTFSISATPYRSFNPNTGAETFADYDTACPGDGDPCNNGCGMYQYDYDKSQKVSLSVEQISKMDKVERILMTGAGVNDEFVIKKPLVINAYNASTYIPSFGMTAANYCESVTFATQLNLSVKSGLLGWASLGHGYSLNNSWDHENANVDYWDQNVKSAVFAPTFNAANGSVIHHTYLYVSARDEFDRQFVRRVTCNEN